MTVLVYVTWAALGLLVLALAVYLVAIMLILREIRQTAGLILFGVRAIAEQASPIGDIVGEIRDDITTAREAVSGTIERTGAHVVRGPRERRAEETQPAAVQKGADTSVTQPGISGEARAMRARRRARRA